MLIWMPVVKLSLNLDCNLSTIAASTFPAQCKMIGTTHLHGCYSQAVAQGLPINEFPIPGGCHASALAGTETYGHPLLNAENEPR